MTQVENITCVRIIARLKRYVIEVVYELLNKFALNNSKAVVAMDIGVNNLSALTSNQKGFTPIMVNGQLLKSINQFYNKTRAKLQSRLKEELRASNQIQRLTAKRNNQIKNYFLFCSRWIINDLEEWGIGKLIIGQKPFWKHWVNNR